MRRELLLLAGTLLSCNGESTGPDIPDDAEFVPFTSLNAFFGGARISSQWMGGRARLELRSQSEWGAVYTQATGDPDPTSILFDDRAVFFAATGLRQSTGYDISIDDVRKDARGQLYIVVREIRPGTGCGVLPSVTSPVTAIHTIREYTRVIYIERVQIDPCTVS